jgi:signal transduction histidine kinase
MGRKNFNAEGTEELCVPGVAVFAAQRSVIDRGFAALLPRPSMDFAYELTPLVAAKLMVYSLGALVHLFLMVVLLGQRRLGRLEWLLFWLISALFMWNTGNLLALNVGLYYGVGPAVQTGIARWIAFTGLVLCAPLGVHALAEYARRFHPLGLGARLLPALFYAPLAGYPWMLGALLGHPQAESLAALYPYARWIAVWVALAMFVAAGWNLLLWRGGGTDRAQWRPLHPGLAALQILLGTGIAALYVARPLPAQGLGSWPAAGLMLVAVMPGVWAGYGVFRHQLLQIRIQRNLVFAVVGGFALLAYLDFIRRLSVFLQERDLLPVAVTETVMIFVLVALVEPAKRFTNRLLHRAFVSEYEKIQRLGTEIQEFAKQSGDLEALGRMIAERVPRELTLVSARLLAAPGAGVELPAPSSYKARRLPISRGDRIIGTLEVVPLTNDLSGDQAAALAALAGELAAALELCQLIADKVKLERELGEKEKMAFLGEMSARIAHNVKNPLSSMKTLVQLLEEDSSLSERARRDCTLVLQEIDRLNRNISQVLRYAKPARDSDRPCDLAMIARRVIDFSRPEVERRSVRLEFNGPDSGCRVQGGEEAAADIISNLLVNALEAASAGGSVRVGIRAEEHPSPGIVLEVEDDGPGISPELQDKIFQPFFTTRPGGTGLGLAIVKRRAEEMGATVECVRATSLARGTMFTVTFRRAT